MYFISGAQNRKLIWSHSKSLTSRQSVLYSFQAMFNFPQSAVNLLLNDQSGIGLHPHPAGRDIEPEHRILHLTHKTIVDCLAGSHLVSIASTFQQSFRSRVCDVKAEFGWTEFPCLLEFLKSEMLCAAVEALCGEQLLALNPGFVDDFWALDKGMPYFLKQYPSWILHTALRARMRCVMYVKRWHRYAKIRMQSDVNSSRGSLYGSKLMEKRQEYSSKMKSLDEDALACADLGLIWA